MPSMLREAGETIATLVKGFSVTFRTMLRKTVTENYPEEPVHFQARYRGIHVLHRDESGLEKCVGCFLCAAACRPIAFTLKPRKIRMPIVCRQVNVTLASTTSNIHAAISADTAGRPAPPTRSSIATELSWP